MTTHKYCMDLSQLFERREAPLYHGTSPWTAVAILSDDQILAATGHSPSLIKAQSKTPMVRGVSLTRDIRIARRFGPVVFVLDQEALASRHKIVPVDYWHRAPEAKHSRRRGDYHEAEEFCIGDIRPASRYVRSILISPSTKATIERDNGSFYEVLLKHPLLREM